MTTTSPQPARSTEPGQERDYSIRTFREEDRGRLDQIGAAIDPDEKGDLESWRYHDEQWNHERFFMLRLVAERTDGTILGWGQVQHMPWQFHPDTYALDLRVDPPAQGQGIGSALMEPFLAALDARGAKRVRAAAKESRTNSVTFLLHRGFEEIQRYWESRLDVAAFDFDAFATAEERATAQGITLTTLKEELERDPDCLRAVYETEQQAFLDVPFPDPATPVDFDEWLKHEFNSPNNLLDAFFLAKEGDRYAGLSNLHRNPEQPGVLFQAFTGVLREYRGKGVAMALKMQTVKYARAHEYREIRTGNNTRNQPMLRINEAMGFVKQPAWVEFEKRLG